MAATGDVRSESEKVGGFKREVGGVAEEKRERESFGGVSKVSSNEGAKTAETEKSRGYGVVFGLCVVG